MFYVALAVDYDGTLAEHGAVDAQTIAAVELVQRSRRRTILATGRQRDDLERVFPRLDLFDRVVAENGAVLYRPGDKTLRLLGEAPPDAFISALRARGVTPLSVGSVIIATTEPQQDAVLAAINDLGLELQIIFNKGAVMVLPSGINKANGVVAALHELALSPINAVAVGDGENDHALLKACGCGVAVANAVPTLLESADWVAPGESRAGVAAVIDALLRDDLASITACQRRHRILLGRYAGGELTLSATGNSRMLVCGSSASGKSSFTAGFLERLTASGLRYCLVDPEGDYQGIEDAISEGGPREPPSLSQVCELLQRSDHNVAVNLLGVALGDRPRFFVALLGALLQLREDIGRPHWIVVDEAHHMLPQEIEASGRPLAAVLPRMVFVTVHPGQLNRSVLTSMDWLVALGKTKETIQSYAQAAQVAVPQDLPDALAPGRALVWRIADGGPSAEITVISPKGEHLRHVRKYATGDLGPDRSFYFRGPQSKLNLRAQNLNMFCQLLEGVDDATWQYHLAARDYSRWMRESIKDNELADEVMAVEVEGAKAGDIRSKIREAIERRYTNAG
jgi:HAD superfamily hydrolase (TIGR01484 family)